MLAFRCLALVVVWFACWLAPDSFLQAGDPQLAHMVYFTLSDKSEAEKDKLVAACHKFLAGHEGTVYFSVGVMAWDLYPTEMKGTARAYGGPKWHTMTHCYRHRLVPGGEPISEDGFASTYQLLPENVVNGWNRAVHGVPNSWAPDARQPGPHWIELDFGQPAAINEVHVTFQLPNMAAEAYDLAAPAGQDWRTVCTVHGNNQRRRVHRFDKIHASRLRLTLKGDLATGKPVRLCEIRVYGK